MPEQIIRPAGRPQSLIRLPGVTPVIVGTIVAAGGTGGGGGGGGGITFDSDGTITDGTLTIQVALDADVAALAASTTAGLATKPPTSRAITAGTGLTGGGDLSADRSLAVNYGTTAGTAAQGNDTRIVGALQAANNLADVASPATSRTNLGLGTAAVVNTGTTSGTVPVLGASGTLAIARLATGTPDGTKFVRDDGTLAVPAGGVGGGVSTVVGLTDDVTGAEILADPTVAGALAAKAPLASPALTGVPTTPTAAVDTETTQVASTAFVVGQAAAATPLVNGTAAAGTSTRFARADHVHPTDTTRVPTSRAITAGTGLTGGGDLSADRSLAVNYGTTAGTAAQGNDSRIVGALQAANNLSDVASAATVRTNLGLGTAAVVNTGTTSGTVPVLGASGTLAIARLATGTPDGTKFVRDDGTLATPADGGGSAVPAFIPRPMYGGGLWWPTVVTAGSATASFPNNWELTWPAIYSNDFDIDQVAIQVTTAVAAAAFRVGIYDSTGTGGLPGNLITEFTSATQFDASTTGIKAVTGSYSFVAGTLYWWQLHVNGTATIRTYANVPRPALRTSGTATDALAPILRQCFERNRGSFGALSATWGSAGFAAGESHPAVAVRVV